MIAEYFFDSKKIKNFENVLRQNNYKKDFAGFLRESTAIGALFFVAGIAVLALTKTGSAYMIVLAFLCFAVGFFANFFVQYYLFDLRKRKIEKFVPDLLLLASVFPRGTNLEKIISHFAKTNYAVLSGEFEKCRVEILKGNSPVLALESMKKRNGSKVLGRAIDLIVSGINSGSDAAVVFKETAADLLETASILRERSASLTIEKYTLLFAGGIIVPAILGVLIGIVSGLDFAALSEIGVGLPVAQRKALIDAALFASPVYLAEYSVIASFFVAFQEGDLKKGAIYSLFLVPASLAVYFFVPGFF